MQNKTIRKVVNIDKINYSPLFTFKQEDDVIIRLSLYNNSMPFDVTGQTMALGAKRQNNSLLRMTDGFTINKNEVDIELKNSILAVPGKVEFDLEIKDSSGKMTTSSFFVNVEKSVTGESNVNATSEISALEKAKENAEKVMIRLQEINSVAGETETKERERQRQESARISNENIRITNENTRLNDETIRKNNEISRQKSEELRNKKYNEALSKVNNLFEASKDNDLKNTIEAEVIGARGIYSNLGERLEQITGTLDEQGKVVGVGKLDTNSQTIIDAINEIFAYIRTIPVELKGITLDPIELPMYVGDNKKINVIYHPTSATNKKVKWESSSSSVASIDNNGNVVGRSVGNCTITVTSEEGKFIAVANVSVSEKETTVNIFKIGFDNATTPLDLPIVVNGDTDVVHPSVLYFKDGWNGYKYWMAINPYPKTQSKFENPWLVKSNKPDSGWELAHEGAIYDIPEGTVHNSDCNIFMDKDGVTMHYINRAATQNGCIIEYFSTTDGATFTDRKTIIHEIEGHNYLSPSVCVYNNKYYMFVVDTADQSVVTVLEATNLEDEWKKVNEISMPGCTKFWHGEVKWVNEEFVAMFTSGDAQGGLLYVGKFTTPSDKQMVTRTTSILSTNGEFGASSLYKCSFVVDENLDVGLFYGTKTARLDATTDWRVAYTKGKRLIPTFKMPSDYELFLNSDDASIFKNESSLYLASLPSHNFVYESVVNKEDVGLLFRADNTTDYIKFSNTATRTKLEHVKSGNVINSSNSYLSVEEYNKVTIVGNGVDIYAYVNDMLVAQLSDQIDDYKEIKVGYMNGNEQSLSNVKVYIPSSENYTTEKATTYYENLWNEYEENQSNFLLADKFERANSDDLGLSLDGKTWNKTGTVKISSNKLLFGSANAMASVTINSSKYSVICKLAASYNNHVLYAKYIDSNNYIRILVDNSTGANVQILKNGALTKYYASYAPYNLTDGFIRIDCNNDNYSFYMNNKPIIEDVEVSGFSDNSVVGLGSSNLVNPSFDGVIVKKM